MALANSHQPSGSFRDWTTEEEARTFIGFFRKAHGRKGADMLVDRRHGAAIDRGNLPDQHGAPKGLELDEPGIQHPAEGGGQVSSAHGITI